MVLHVRDKTGRFGHRPHYKPEEIDVECENIITAFLRDLIGEVRFPIVTDDLTKLIEQDVADLDLYADLSQFGPDVEGVTEFRSGRKPRVKIAQELSEDAYRENRLRTTLTHEYGHVRFHTYLWDLEALQGDLFRKQGQSEVGICKRDTMLRAPQTDWMEWQAGYVCGALLMPVSYVKGLVRSYLEQHDLFSPVHATSHHGQALTALMIDTFQVSHDAARVRLAKLGFIEEFDHGPSLL